jgi:hypothetical protein
MLNFHSISNFSRPKAYQLHITNTAFVTKQDNLTAEITHCNLIAIEAEQDGWI